MLSGRHVTLRILEKGDIETVRKWRNSPHVSGSMANRDLISEAQQEKWYAEQTASRRDLYLMMIDIASTQPIGVLHLEAIDHRNQNAVFGIYVAAQEFRGRPHSYEAACLLFDYCFDYLNLSKITGAIIASNTRSRDWVQALGFEEEGILKRQAYLEGRFEDVVNVALSRETWKSVYRDKTLERLTK